MTAATGLGAGFPRRLDKQDASDAGREYWPDLIRTVAIFAVVLLHVCAVFTRSFDPEDIGRWQVANLIESATRACVPLFFMVSGYLLLSSTETLGRFFRRRFSRILIPTLFWSLFYLAIARDSLSIGSHDLWSLLQHPSFYHLWFMYALVGLYAAAPILGLFARNASEPVLAYALILWFVVSSLLPWVQPDESLAEIYSLDLITGYSGYMLAGYYLGHQDFRRRSVIAAGILFVACYVVIAAKSYQISLEAGRFANDYYEYLSPFVILYSLAAFVVLKGLGRAALPGPGGVRQFVAMIAKASFGIYLVHVFFLRHAVPRILLNPEVMGGVQVLQIALTVVVVFVASFLSVLILDRIPVLRRTVT